MIKVEIPGYHTLTLEHLVLDHNGTLAVDGILVPGVRQCLEKLAADLQVHVITADTFGKARAQLEGIPCELSILSAGHQDIGKLEYIKKLGPKACVCIGNGRNDRLMLMRAALGIAVILEEGAAAVSLQAADIVCNGIVPALELLLNPLRLKATLRS
jgi:soluble P-type ATPase